MHPAVTVLKRPPPTSSCSAAITSRSSIANYIGPVAELLTPLAGAPYGSFAVLGNHDDEREVPAALASRGFTVLKDQRTALTIKGERLDIAGIRFWTQNAGEIAGVLKGTGGTTILLAHDPRRLAEAAALDVQLVLSGHTHGGQVLVPAVGPIAGRKFPVLAGYATQENTALFVSRGVGTVYVPVRINCPPDVAILTLRTAGLAFSSESPQTPRAGPVGNVHGLDLGIQVGHLIGQHVLAADGGFG